MENLCIVGEKGDLSAILERPQGGGSPLAIICHGLFANKDKPINSAFAKALLQRNVSALRFDFYGCGESAGRFEDMTLHSQIADIKSVHAWARAQGWVEKIVIIGHSQGAVAAVMAAAELGASEIPAIAIQSVASVLRDDALRGMIMGEHFDPFAIPAEGVLLREGFRVGRDYLAGLQTLPIYETAASYTGKALIIHGLKDVVSPYTYAQRFHYLWPESQLELVEGAVHSFAGMEEESAEKIAEFLDNSI